MVISYILNKGAELVGKKWRAVVIWHLRPGPLRFSEIKRKIPGVSVKVLSEVLQEMEQHELIIRTQYNTIPVKVIYQLHPEATAFVEANILCTIRIGEYLTRNREKTSTSKEMAEQIDAFLADYRKQTTK
jgi:DNA-binding HxlR family transcriptional regulator